jgi:hypothetical protein
VDFEPVRARRLQLVRADPDHERRERPFLSPCSTETRPDRTRIAGEGTDDADEEVSAQAEDEAEPVLDAPDALRYGVPPCAAFSVPLSPPA